MFKYTFNNVFRYKFEKIVSTIYMPAEILVLACTHTHMHTQLDRLQRIQNRAMRIILRCNRRTRVFDMLSSLRWMNERQRIHVNLCTLMWKIVHGRTPNYLCNFQLNSDIHKYTTRSTNKLCVNHAHPNVLSYRGVRTWFHSRSEISTIYLVLKGHVPNIFLTVNNYFHVIACLLCT
jgi:hypothetical protein